MEKLTLKDLEKYNLWELKKIKLKYKIKKNYDDQIKKLYKYNRNQITIAIWKNKTKIKQKKFSKSQLQSDCNELCAVYTIARDCWNDTHTFDWCHCISCWKYTIWDWYLQCGHFITRMNKYLLYDEINTNAQCFSCNCKKWWNSYLYYIWLDKKYGVWTATSLYNKSLEYDRWEKEWLSVPELFDKIKWYMEKIEEINKNDRKTDLWTKRRDSMKVRNKYIEYFSNNNINNNV